MTTLTVDCSYTYDDGFHVAAPFATSSLVTALIGPSGSGKTTVLKLVAGLLKPETGSIRLGDRLLTNISKRLHLPPEQRDIGFVFQDLRLFPHLTVEQNLQYGSKRTTVKTVALEEVVELLELGDLLSRLPRKLSGGQQQRVALGRALLRSPQLLLLDEPLASLDQPLQHRIVGYLQKVIDRFQIPTVLVTHDLSSISILKPSVLSIQQGKITPTGGSTSVDQSG